MNKRGENMNNIQFSEKEKEIIRELVKYDFSKKTNGSSNDPQLITLGWFLQNKIYTNPDYQIIIRPKECGMIWYKEGFQSDAYYYLMTPILLIYRLIENNLLVLFPMDESINNDKGYMYFGTQKIIKEDEKYIYFDSNEKMSKIDGHGSWLDSNQNIKYCSNKFNFNQVPILDLIGLWPIVTPKLKELVKNNFKTVEQKSLFWTRIAAVASFGAFLASIIIPHACSTRINSEQYNGFMKSDTTTRQEIVTKLDAIDESTHQIFNAKTDTIIK